MTSIIDSVEAKAHARLRDAAAEANLVELANMIRSRGALLDDDNHRLLLGPNGPTEMRLRYSRELEIIVPYLLDKIGV